MVQAMANDVVFSAGGSAGSEIKLTASEFQLISELAYERFGLDLKRGKEALVASRLGKKLRKLGFATFAEYQRLDVTIDGADEVQLGTLDLIKGRGGALLREKIVAAASRRLIIVVDQEKLIEQLGELTPVPVEVTQFGWQATAVALARLGCVPERRYAAGEQPYVTDGGNYILDCRFGPIADPRAVEKSIAMTVGAVESGLFVGRSSMVVAASTTGIEILTPPR